MPKSLKSGFQTEKNYESKSKDYSPMSDTNQKSSTLRKKNNFGALVIAKSRSSGLYKKMSEASVDSVLAFNNPFVRAESRTFEIPFQDDPKIADHKALIERSQQLAMKRKRNSEKSPLKLAPLPHREAQNQQQMGRTLTRFIDRMILKGSLPMEATEFFVPEKKKVNIKSQIKLKPIQRKEDGRTSTIPTDVNESVIGGGKVLVKDLIPSWMTGLEEFNERYKTTQQTSKIPVIDILKKPWQDRDDIEENFLLKWLSKIDLFTKHSYDILINLTKRLKYKIVEEGKILCNVGDSADCLYIIYEGEIEVLIPQKTGDLLAVKSSAGEILGRQSLDKPGKRAAKLRASKFSYIIMLFRSDYQEVTGNKANVIKPAQHIIDFIMNHSFLRQFTEAKKLALANEMEYRTYYKNDLIYNLGEKSDKIYLLMEGIVTREMPITREKINKWPTSMDRWEMYKKVSKYAVKLPIEIGEIFGIDDMVNEKARSEKVLVEGDAKVLACPRSLFYEGKRVIGDRE